MYFGTKSYLKTPATTLPNTLFCPVLFKIVLQILPKKKLVSRQTWISFQILNRLNKQFPLQTIVFIFRISMKSKESKMVILSNEFSCV